jgi:competence ComEA-like helix-hairpin-helix protein
MITWGPNSKDSMSRNLLGFMLALALAVLILAFARRAGLGDEEKTLDQWAHFIDLNRAEREELALLPGIGPSLANEIVKDREAKGPFLRLSDLERVKGLGPAKGAALAPRVVLKEEESAKPRAP